MASSVLEQCAARRWKVNKYTKLPVVVTVAKTVLCYHMFEQGLIRAHIGIQERVKVGPRHYYRGAYQFWTGVNMMET